METAQCPTIMLRQVLAEPDGCAPYLKHLTVGADRVDAVAREAELRSDSILTIGQRLMTAGPLKQKRG